ncbi:DUF6519 domain-containing protein [Methylogaea oryzae]|uniref:DUF6519 domain-containing protein n=1 Tax=Methylogaea oryzae TaxID=1295382 RepID=UPI0006CF60E9|nr:DUF6519 domain-containing protein [Methylogaea oryzae]
MKELKAQQAALKKQLSVETDPNKIQDLKTSLDKVSTEIAVLGTATGEAAGAGPGVSCGTPLKDLPPFGQAWLAAGLADPTGKEDPCVTPPDSKYRGVENQLYRVEIHRGGPADVATFKWSRDNGSVATRWLGSQGSDLLVANTRGFAAGNWVELSDDAKELQGGDAQGKPRSVLVKLVKVENGVLTVDPATASDSSALAWRASLPNPTVRRWDQVERGDVLLDGGAVPVKEPAGGQQGWIDLEDGVRVQFSPGGQYRCGDYWLIPARVATGRLEWPADSDASGKETPKALPPRGIAHHYAPLGFVSWQDGEFQYQTCRCEFSPMSVCPGDLAA